MCQSDTTLTQRRPVPDGWPPRKGAWQAPPRQVPSSPPLATTPTARLVLATLAPAPSGCASAPRAPHALHSSQQDRAAPALSCSSYRQLAVRDNRVSCANCTGIGCHPSPAAHTSGAGRSGVVALARDTQPPVPKECEPLSGPQVQYLRDTATAMKVDERGSPRIPGAVGMKWDSQSRAATAGLQHANPGSHRCQGLAPFAPRPQLHI